MNDNPISMQRQNFKIAQIFMMLTNAHLPTVLKWLQRLDVPNLPSRSLSYEWLAQEADFAVPSVPFRIPRASEVETVIRCYCVKLRLKSRTRSQMFVLLGFDLKHEFLAFKFFTGLPNFGELQDFLLKFQAELGLPIRDAHLLQNWRLPNEIAYLSITTKQLDESKKISLKHLSRRKFITLHCEDLPFDNAVALLEGIESKLTYRQFYTMLLTLAQKHNDFCMERIFASRMQFLAKSKAAKYPIFGHGLLFGMHTSEIKKLVKNPRRIPRCNFTHLNLE